MKLIKKDFIEIEFTGKLRDGNIFDSNIKKDLQKLNSNTPAKPFVFCLGEDMFLKGIDEFFIDKDVEINKEYKIELKPEQAFGLRDSKLVQMIPMRIFKEQKVNPFPGAIFNFDGKIAKILTVSGGRVMADFNNPLAGKEVIYFVKILRKIEKAEDKINSLNNFFFRREFKFEIKDKKLVLEAEKEMSQFILMFKDKYKEILNLDLEVKEISKMIKQN